MSKHHDKHKHPKHDKDKPESPMEGEGSRTAASHYSSHLRLFIDEKRVEPAAKEAEDFVEHHAAEAAADEKKAKAGPRPMLKRLEELATEGRAMWHRASERVRHVIRRRMQRRA